MVHLPEIKYPVGVAGDPMVPHIARVGRRWRHGPQVWTLEIERQDTERQFVPGQFNMLTVFGVGEVPISIDGDPAVRDRYIHTVRAVGPVSTALARLHPGDVLGLRGPFGTGWPMAEASGRDVVMMAGGLGIAPLRPVLYSILADRARYGKLVLIYGARDSASLIFRQQLESWQRGFDLTIEVTVDHSGPEWHGHVGPVTKLVSHVAFDARNTIAMICGPEIMMRFSASALEELGIEDHSIYISMERNMKCAVGFCGRCQFGTVFICRDGPVFRYDRVRSLLRLKEI